MSIEGLRGFNHLHSIDIMSRHNRKPGWIRDKHDHRDLKFGAVIKLSTDPLPESIDNRNLAPPVFDQGHLGSCTAHGTLAAFRMTLKQENKPDFEASRLAHYALSRQMEGMLDQDSGAEIRDAVKVLSENGTILESEWPYDVSRFRELPGSTLLTEALQHKCLVYESVPLNKEAFKRAIVENGSVIIGITLYESFMSYEVERTGIVPTPNTAIEEIDGGHCMLAVGYTNHETAIVRNSWGTSWGQSGYCEIPLSYLLNPELAGDYWTLRDIDAV
jgi:C1A family cysteine protease